MSEDWGRLSQAIADAREALGMTQIELGEAIGVGRSAVQKMERGVAYTKVQPTHRAAARVFGWAEGSIEQILAGGEPKRAQGDRAAESTPDSVLGDLPLRVLHAIGSGRLVDSAVINLDPEDPEAAAVLVLKRGRRSDATPEQLREDLRKWSELERAVRRIYGDDQSS